MKSLIKISIVFVIGAVCICSCDMDEFFKDQRPPESVWINTSTFERGLTSCYRHIYFVDRGYQAMIDYAQNGCSQLLPGTSTSVPYLELTRRSFDVQWDDFWREWYRAITISNAAIELNDDFNGNPFGLDLSGSDYKDNYIRQLGEYYFVRGYAYFSLLRFYTPSYARNGSNDQRYIPFYTKIAKTMYDIREAPLGTNEEIYAQVISDLRKAKELLPEKFNANTMHRNYERSRTTTYSAAALLAKVLFLMGKYSEAEGELNYVISASETKGLYALEAPVDAFNKLRAQGTAKETLLEFDSGRIGGTNVLDYMYFGMIINLNFRDASGGGRGTGMMKSGWNQWSMSYWMLKEIGWMTDPQNGDYSLTQAALDDLRLDYNLGTYYHLLGYKVITPNNNTNPEYFLYETMSEHSQVTTPQMYVDKYFRGGAPGTTESGRHTCFPLIRLADIYLIRAWVRWKGGNTSGAASDINKVWNRSNPNNPDIYTASNVNHDAIFREYLREMTGETWTTDFMMATQMPIPPGDRVGVSPVQPPYTGWYWPISISELDLNPNY